MSSSDPNQKRPAPSEPQRSTMSTSLSLADEAALMRTIIATATEGIVTMTPGGRIELVNRAAELMFGFAPGELIGQDVTTLMPNPYRDEHSSYVQNYLDSGQARVIGIGREVVAKRKDGSQFPIHLSVGEGLVGNRRVFVAILSDISVRKELQARLSLAERLVAIGELAAGVAHEINNPINTILNCAQLIRDGDSPTENSSMIADEATRIAGIVQDLLQFARNDKRELVATDLADVAQRTVRLVRENFAKASVDIQVHVEPGTPTVRANRSQLQQVLLNLLNNARDAVLARQSGQKLVMVRAMPQQGGASIAVRDTGIGILPELADRIFEPFFTTKRARGGTGLGLSISKSIVDSFGGTITVESEPGQGAEFRVWLPAENEPAI
jgi:two-component system sensor kinase FixL